MAWKQKKIYLNDFIFYLQDKQSYQLHSFLDTDMELPADSEI